MPRRWVGAVYPRVDGGTLLYKERAVNGEGLSPRGRGNRLKQVVAGDDERSIPAWTGEPVQAPVEATDPKVYPRVDGGTPSLTLWSRDGAGLSPRGRGNRPGHILRVPDQGSIPAWTGEPPAG